VVAVGVVGVVLVGVVAPGTEHTVPPGVPLTVSATAVAGRLVMSAPTAVAITVHR
jgi:hypothetical protein